MEEEYDEDIDVARLSPQELEEMGQKLMEKQKTALLSGDELQILEEYWTMVKRGQEERKQQADVRKVQQEIQWNMDEEKAVDNSLAQMVSAFQDQEQKRQHAANQQAQARVQTQTQLVQAWMAASTNLINGVYDRIDSLEKKMDQQRQEARDYVDYSLKKDNLEKKKEQLAKRKLELTETLTRKQKKARKNNQRKKQRRLAQSGKCPC